MFKDNIQVVLPKKVFEGAKPILELLKELPEKHHKEFFEFVPAHGKDALVSRWFLDEFKIKKGIKDDPISSKNVLVPSKPILKTESGKKQTKNRTK